MSRRLKDRIPAALRRSKGKVPPLLVLFMTTTLCIAPKALAQVESGTAELRFVTQTYSKDDLKKTLPANPNVSIDDEIAKEVHSLMASVTSGIASPGRFAQLDLMKSRPPEADEYFRRAAIMADAPTNTEADIKGVKSCIGLEIQKAARKDVAAKFAAYTKMLNLARFNLNFSSLFSRGSSQPAPSSGNIRYGLVVKEINPDTSNPKLASINDSYDEMQYAGHADVKWAIEPVTETDGRRVFEGVAPDVIPPPAPDEGGWKLHVPRASFHTNASTDTVEDYSKVSASALPSAKFELTQDEDFYKLVYHTTLHGQRLGVDHILKLPIAGTVSIGRRFNERFQTVETSAYNILYDKHLPMLSIHQMVIEKRYKAELSANFAGGHALGIAYRGEAKGPVEVPGEEPAAGSLNYYHDF